MGDDTMSRFGKVLRRSECNLFKLQVETSVNCSDCLMTDYMSVQNPRESREQKYYVGLYRNNHPDSFLIFYIDKERRDPIDMIWLKDCLVTKGKMRLHDTVTIHCPTSIDVDLILDSSKKRRKWYKTIKAEIEHLQKQKRFSNASLVVSPSKDISEEIDQIFSIEKQGCLRQCSRRSTLGSRTNLKDLFEQIQV